MENLRNLLSRYRQAEIYFESENVSNEEKEKHINNLKKLINAIDNEYKRLKLTQEQLKDEMIKANIEVGEV